MSISLSYNGVNCYYSGTLTTNPYTWTGSGDVYMRFIPHDGYSWNEETPENNYVTDFTTEEVTIVDTSFTDVNGKRQINVRLSMKDKTISGDRYITFTPPNGGSSTTTYNVTKSLTNCTCNSESTYEENTEVTATITATDGYYFKEKPVVTMGSETIEVTTEQTEYPTTYNATFVITSDVTINASAEEKPTLYAINTNITNATCNIESGTMYEKGETVHITVKADNGYYFATAPTITYYSKGVQVTKIMESDDSGDYKQNFYYDLTLSNTTTVNADGQVIPEIDKYGIITIYNPTPNELKAIGNVRYMGDVDLGNYISNLIKVYVKIPQGQRANVLLGGYNTNVESNVIVTDIIETDCGTVEIVGNYNNAMDYENTTIEMYLPFIGFVELDTKKVMNETISLVYKTNIINGDTIACIYNTTGTLLYTFNSTASFEIPYKLNADNEPQGQLQVNSNYLFGFTPFVTIRYNKTLNTSNVVANDERLTKLINESGFVRCSEVFNTIKATTNEKEEIETLLKGGVIV